MGKTKQVAAIPVRIGDDGSLRVMLVTSRETKRYVLPKGWPWPGHKDYRAAEREAHEEAGIVGKARKKSVGAYLYDKRRPDGSVKVKVKVFVLAVEKLLDSWPEQHERTRAWFTLAQAAELVDEPELAELLRSLRPDPKSTVSDSETKAQ